MEKYIRVIQATDDNKICWINKATDTHLDNVIIIAFSTTTMGILPFLNVNLNVHCLSLKHFLSTISI